MKITNRLLCFGFLQAAAIIVGLWGAVEIESQFSAYAEDGISESDRLGARSDEYSRVFDKALHALVEGDAATFRALLSSLTVLSENRGPGAVDVIIRDRFIPFFSGFEKLTDSINTMPTFNSRGEIGIALARSFVTKDGERRNFVMYLIKEGKDGKVVVGNLLLNATEKDLEAAKARRPGAKE
jgi:hypothetical protein